MKALSMTKREKLTDKLLNEFCDGQSSDEYYFEIDSVRLVWLQNIEMWVALWEKPYGEIQPWEPYRPCDLWKFVATLSDEQLVKFCDDFFVV